MSAMRDLRSLFDSGTTAGLSDEQLLRRYADRMAEAEAAFEALVDRHGPMVWGVCRRALGRSHEAEDAFQATFLILARRANAVRVDGSLGRWLHGVASRVAVGARADGLERPDPGAASRDGRAVEISAPTRRRMSCWRQRTRSWVAFEKYRAPMVLCHLEGLTYAGAPNSSVARRSAGQGRLDRGHELLRARLRRRGLGLPASSMGPWIIPEARPVVPSLLAESTARVASAAAHPAIVAGVSTSAFTLARGVVQNHVPDSMDKVAGPAGPGPAWPLLPGGTSRLEAGRRPAPAPDRRGESPGSPRTTAKPDPRSTAIAVPLPGRDELRALLRRAAEEVTAIASKEPQQFSCRHLMTIAKTQALTGDPDRPPGKPSRLPSARPRASSEVSPMPGTSGGLATTRLRPGSATMLA